jgi:hypothetical protein
MDYTVDKDDAGNVKMQADKVTPKTSMFVALAIPKGAEQAWYQTEWGAQMYAAGQAGWPNGEFQAATFAWKVEDGDSMIPNKKGKKNCDREGFPGNWIIKGTTQIPVACHHTGKYQAHECIQDKGQIKTGDYARMSIQVRGNAPSQSPGIYVNPQLFELVRAGIQIVGGGPDAADVFGGAPAPVMPEGAQIQQGVPAPVAPAPAAPVAPAPAAPVAPAPEVLAPPPAPTAEPTYNVGGTEFTKAQLISSGWSEAQVAAL